MICKKCGAALPENGAFCPDCGAPVKEAPPIPDVMADPAPEVLQKPENVFGGIIGALIGAALGALSIILFMQMDLVSAISGLILAFCTLKGYELLGGRLGGTGLVICIALMLITPYIADRISWSILIVQASDGQLEFMDTFKNLHSMISAAEVEADYIQNLIMIYGFAALGGVGTIINKFKKKK